MRVQLGCIPGINEKAIRKRVSRAVIDRLIKPLILFFVGYNSEVGNTQKGGKTY